ncbi:MAG: hypothetical protein C4542_05190 [Dehalococcoidia bacterium]|nr:MAG: hypothetical protein C4542_05190 [Dehalococcoidia bacterium]
MIMKKYEVCLYHSTYQRIEVEANSREEAHKKATEKELDKDEIIGNLERWPEADEIKLTKDED